MWKKYIIGVFALCCANFAVAQSLEQAKQLFLAGEYEQAKPVFQKLVKQAPSNANYNYWYGVCCYETGEKQEAQPYLEKSAARKVIDAYLYLARLYYDFYRFDDAVDNYEEHINWLEKKKRPTEQAEAELETAKLAVRMIKGVEDVAVIDSFVVDKDDFLSVYKISKESGQVYRAKDTMSTIYETEMGNKMIYSGMAADSTLQLYSRNRLLDGWSVGEPLTFLNKGGNADYPFLMPDGLTLYFAADGESSLGGYDIFVTRYDTEDGTYLRPDHLGMPFNSPANDYMYVIDELNEIGWFASDRYQPEGQVCIYVFVPNASKKVYDYENTDEQTLIEVATLRSIRTTWTDEAKVRQGKQRLAALMYTKESGQTEGDFTFIVDDSSIYHTWADFRSAEACQHYRELVQKQQDVTTLQDELIAKRDQYAQGDNSRKKELAPAILEQEQRIKQLWEEIRQLETTMRNEEIKQLRR